MIAMLLALTGGVTPGWSKGCMIAGENRTDISDADCTEAQTTGCISHLLSDKQYGNCLAAQPPDKLAKVCRDYSVEIMLKLTEATKIGCGFVGQWSQKIREHEGFCNRNPEQIRKMRRTLEKDLYNCKIDVDNAAAAGSGGKTAKVVKDVDVYDAPGGGGNQTGSLNGGTQVGFAGCDGDWCHITGGNVPNGDGYVYNGADYRSLKF
ncbi:MAG: hypothetical protein U1E49_21200 [Hyphomicrobiaceae bacterium]